VILSIDIETYSSNDLVKSGVFKYVDSPDFEILLFAYAFGDEPVMLVDLKRGEQLPERVKSALLSKKYTKTAFNAQFEITCIQKYFKVDLDISQWSCTALMASELGLPQSLKNVAKVLHLDEQKDSRGKRLIDYFCKPCKPTATNGERTRNLPEHRPEDWQVFCDYCKQDVEVERSIRNKIKAFPIADSEQKLWELDQRINARGVRIDGNFVNNAISYDEKARADFKAEAVRITGLENPNSLSQLKAWLGEKTGCEYKSLAKADIEEILKNTDDEEVKRVIEIRKALGKTSNAKYTALRNSACDDGRVRGMLQFYGANRTGRWAGRIVQPQNLPQNHLKNIADVRELVADGDYNFFSCLYDVSQTLSELIRTAFVPSVGRRFIVSDFSAIEARVLSYLADEKWRIEVFKNNGDIYCASASQMFGVPVVKHGVNGHLRQKGKIAELALGYGGSVGALVSMGALKMGIPENELDGIVQAWRNSNPRITEFWKTVENATISAIKGMPCEIQGSIGFYRKSGILFVRLPSGRSIAYAQPAIGVNRFGRDCVTYMGMNQTSKKWECVETFGGKLVENIVQAFARDCLAVSMQRLEEKGYEINFTVHDEVILDVPNNKGSLEEVTNIMGQPIEWAKGLLLRADGYECDFYMKD
jgi:DNA polymerase